MTEQIGKREANLGKREANLGKREMNRRANLERIMTAAQGLLQERDFDQVTTAELADRAGVSTGTLFRHIGTKADLLITFMGEHLAMPAQTQRPATTRALASDAIFALLEPFLDLAVQQERNALAFHREVLYGNAQGQARQKIVHVVQRFEPKIYEILGELEGNQRVSERDRARIAHAMYSSIYMNFLQVSTGSADMGDIHERMKESIAFLLERA